MVVLAQKYTDKKVVLIHVLLQMRCQPLLVGIVIIPFLLVNFLMVLKVFPNLTKENIIYGMSQAVFLQPTFFLTDV